jgi:hypothetical protein
MVLSSQTPGETLAADRTHRRWSVVAPVTLIALGGLLLLNNLGVVPWDVWGTLWRFWPLALVIAGLELLLGNRGSALWLLIAAVVAVAALAIFFATPQQSRGVESGSLTQSLQGATQADVSVNFGAGRLTLGALANPTGDQLAQVNYDGPPGLRPESSYRVRNGRGELDLRVERGEQWMPWPLMAGRPGGAEMHVLLAPGVPTTLKMDAGAAEAHVDLSGLRITQFDLDTGASTTWVRLPEAAGSTRARVKGGASTLTVEVPPNVAADIRFAGGMSTLHVDERRFPAAGPQRYRSPDYDSAQNRVDLVIQVGVATVTVR